jgi:hypothetical protein
MAAKRMSDKMAEATHSQFDYSRPVDLSGEVEPLFRALVNTFAFRRLADVRFLGGIDYFLVPTPNGARTNTRYTRYQHSLGVARLALYYADVVGLPERVRRLGYAAALLHDVGHAPLSHSLEPLFEEAFDLNHHHVTRRIITGDTHLGKDVLQVLLAHHINPDDVLSVIAGDVDPFGGLFSGPINFDTVEGILRARSYIKPKSSSPGPIDVVRAAILRSTPTDRQIVDSFWHCKDVVYRHVIRSRNGILTDHLCQAVARERLHALTKRDLLSTEHALFRKIPKLRSALARRRHIESQVQETVQFISRRFYVDDNCDFFAKEDRNRYRQSRWSETIAAVEF